MTKRYHQLFRRWQGETLTACGHFNAKEIKQLKRDGYRFHEPQVNRNGIQVSDRRVS